MPKRNKRRFDREYAQLMINHPWGWALYKPTSSIDLKPGACGFFDAQGDWQTIVHLTDKAAVEGQKWEPVQSETQLKVETDKGTIKWRPKKSETVTVINMDLKSGLQ